MPPPPATAPRILIAESETSRTCDVARTLTGEEFAGYRIDGLIGGGGMGVVYRAMDPALERTVALKLLAPGLAEDAAFRERFITESKLAASLEHPNVIPIYQAGEHEGVLFLAMRYVPGDDVRTLVRREGALDPLRAGRVIAQVAAALEVAHECGLVHRDVKPANLLLGRGEHVYLTDFGLSKRLGGEEHTPTGELLGTLDFVAPEQIRGEPVCRETDVYALACTSFDVLTGRVPFPVETQEGKLWAHLSEPPPAATVLVPSLPPAIDEVLAKGMSKEPADRHPSALAFASALSAAAAPTADRSAAVAPPARRSPRTAPGLRAPGRPPAPGARRPARAALEARSDRGREVRAALGPALMEPFNLVVLAALLVTGAALGSLVLMIPLALTVYAVAVTHSVLTMLADRRAGQKPAPERPAPMSSPPPPPPTATARRRAERR
jgi:serine/threonine protein kinase